jgi:hypothetical protein
MGLCNVRMLVGEEAMLETVGDKGIVRVVFEMGGRLNSVKTENTGREDM